MDSIGQSKHSSALANIIADEVARSGVISFARFMELALYHREHGYYRKCLIGKAGDFFTSVSVGPLFGQMLGHYLSKILAPLPGELQIVEAGANDGSLAFDTLDWLARNRAELAGRVTYVIAEPLLQLQERQRTRLAGFKVKWVGDIEELAEIRGAILSNELLDSFPVHIFRWNTIRRRWREYGVDAAFQFAPMENLPDWAGKALEELKPLHPHLPDNFTVELNPTAERWWQNAATKLATGVMIAFDYGDEALNMWSPSRAYGTVRAFRNHRLESDPLANPGEQDLTSSVNFTRIRAAGESIGLISSPLQTQAQFLNKIAVEFFSDPTANEVRQFQTLTHPEHLGRAFKVLVQSRTSS